MIHKADIVPWFIGAWVLLKFAGGWKRYVDPSPRNRAIYQVAILGNVVSIGIAVLIGLAYIHLCVASLAPSTTPLSAPQTPVSALGCMQPENPRLDSGATVGDG
jgi:hypothetical protein